jgi:hypothetical protein
VKLKYLGRQEAALRVALAAIEIDANLERRG